MGLITDLIKYIYLKYKFRNKNITLKFPARLGLKDNICLGDNVYIDSNVLISGSVSIDSYTYIKGPSFLESGPNRSIEIGKFCSIARNVTINNSNSHNINAACCYPRHKLIGRREEFSKGDIKIGNDVWIGTNVVILGGVNIGSGAVIGANSLVADNVKPYSIVGGVPAKTIRKRFDDAVIKFLLEINWWDWPKGKILKYKQVLFSEIKDTRQLKDGLK